MRKKTSALQRCDREIRKARKHLKELKDCQTMYELEAFEDEEIKAELQKINEEIDSTEDYLKRMREWKRKSLSKLERWAKEEEDRIKVCEQDEGRVKNEEKGVWDKRR
jgi:flagellar biosynthesis chaperone FliJ